MAAPYAFRMALQSILHEKWINLLSILTIAAGLLFTALTVLSVYNVEMITRKLPEKFSVMLYLRDNLSSEETDSIVNAAQKDPSVIKASLIPKDEALRELKSTLKDAEIILGGLGENPLPDTIEIKLKPDAVGPENIRRLTEKLRDFRGIQEIEYGERFLASIYSLRMGIKTAGMIVVAIMAAGMIFVCYSTVKILFFRKNTEIETYKLLGATKGFIRAPFIIEGAVIGMAGGFLSFVGMLALYYFVVLNLSLSFPIFKMVHFPIEASFVLIPAGLFLGITGSAIAIGRIRY